MSNAIRFQSSKSAVASTPRRRAASSAFARGRTGRPRGRRDDRPAANPGRQRPERAPRPSQRPGIRRCARRRRGASASHGGRRAAKRGLAVERPRADFFELLEKFARARGRSRRGFSPPLAETRKGRDETLRPGCATPRRPRRRARRLGAEPRVISAVSPIKASDPTRRSAPRATRSIAPDSTK